MTFPLNLCRRPGLAAGMVLLLGACSGGPPPRAPVDEGRVDAWALHGYLSATRQAVQEQPDEVMIAGESVGLLWTLPARGQNLPWLIYLPGLGEGLQAGERWRHAWASAGYAVLAIAGPADDQVPAQWLPPAGGEAAEAASGTPEEIRRRLSERRDGLHDWARTRFGVDASAARLGRLVAVLTSLLARRHDGDALLARLDLQRVAMAGYDVGAYTAMLAAGEQATADWHAPTLPLRLEAVIALSPYADFAGSGFSQRYRGVHVPVLSVTGAADVDQPGLVPSSFVRRAPFENMPGQAALLWLRAGSHDLLAGNSARPALAGQAPAVDRSGIARGPTPTDEAVDQVLVDSTSTAFLDAWLRQDPLARQWLDHEAARWVAPRGEFRAR